MQRLTRCLDLSLALSATYEEVVVRIWRRLFLCLSIYFLTLEGCDGNVELPLKALTCPLGRPKATRSPIGISTKADGPFKCLQLS